MERKNAPFSSLLNFNSNTANCCDCLPRKLNVDLLRIFLKFLQKHVNIFKVGKSDQKVYLGHFNVWWVLKRAEEHSHFFLENCGPLLQDQIDILYSNELDFGLVVHQRDQRRRKLPRD